MSQTLREWLQERADNGQRLMVGTNPYKTQTAAAALQLPISLLPALDEPVDEVTFMDLYRAAGYIGHMARTSLVHFVWLEPTDRERVVG